MRRLLAGACLTAASAAHAGSVAMFSAETVTEGRVEAGLLFPDGSTLPTKAMAIAARAAGARNGDVVLWYQDDGIVQLLSMIPPADRVAYQCLPRDGETFTPGAPTTRAAAPGLAPVVWVAQERGRIAWWPAVPMRDACGSSIAVPVVTPSSVDLGDVAVGASAQADVVLANVGRIDLQVRSVAVHGEAFTLLQNGCNNTRLSPGASCSLRAGFAPPAGAAYVGRLEITTSGTPAVLQVPLAGLGSLGTPLGELIFDDGFE